jgi:geranylgeranyl diphosphate synthase type I
VHDFSLLHDDLMDGDRERRHRPTAWTVYGPGPAILAGDALLSLATDLLLEVKGPAGTAAQQLLATAVRRLVHGQADDLDLEARPDVSVGDYVAMAAGKTGALLSCACAIGAALAGAEPKLVGALGAFGEHLGLAFQLVDDLLGMWGAPATTGKPVLSDLRSRKNSAPIVFALTVPGAVSAPLRDYLARAEAADEDELAELARLVERLGGRDRTTAEVQRQLQLAEGSLAGLDLPTDVASELLATARYVTARDR